MPGTGAGQDIEAGMPCARGPYAALSCCQCQRSRPTQPGSANSPAASLGAQSRRRIGLSPMRCSSVAQTSRGPDLDRFVRVLRCFLGDGLLQPLLNASRSSGVAEAGWRGRGFCTDPPIAFSASQPRWGKTAASPSSPAIQAATFERVHSPPSGGGAQRRALSLSSSSGFRTDGLVPFRRRRSPRASRPSALSRASRRSTQRRAYNTVAETSAMGCPLARSQMAWTCRAAVTSVHKRDFSSSPDTLR